MVCKHLNPLEDELLAAGVKEIFRGKAWSLNCREWVYFDCFLDRKSIRERIQFDDCVVDYDHLGSHDGQESGFQCARCKDAIIGIHKDCRDKAKTVIV